MKFWFFGTEYALLGNNIFRSEVVLLCNVSGPINYTIWIIDGISIISVTDCFHVKCLLGIKGVIYKYTNYIRNITTYVNQSCKSASVDTPWVLRFFQKYFAAIELPDTRTWVNTHRPSTSRLKLSYMWAEYIPNSTRRNVDHNSALLTTGSWKHPTPLPAPPPPASDPQVGGVWPVKM